MKRVFVIGLDGLEPTLVDLLIDRGELPNLQRLRQAGCYRRLRTTYPAQTPVAWSSFVTGANPGAHGIFDFIARDPETYQPDMALTRFERPRNALAAPRVVNRRRGVPLWQSLTAAGIPSVVLRCPCTFPPDSIHGKMLAGVGVPDLRGSQSKGTFYTQDRSVAALEHEQLIYLDAGNEITTHVLGPRNTRQDPPGDAACEIRISTGATARQIVIHTVGTPATIKLAEGKWSEWVRFKFKLSLLQSVSGIARFYLRRTVPHLEFYVSAVNFDPASPLFPVSAPALYAKELSEEIGLFSTLGMAEDHNGLNNGRFDEVAYLEQCHLVLAERERMMRHELARFTEGFFFTVFDTPDRVQHMLWRFLDRYHPGFEPDLAPELEARLLEHYRSCDGLLAPVLEAADSDSLVVALSDHGFNTFRRAFDTNTWLWQNGLLAFESGRNPAPGEGFRGVDWAKTAAYAVGLGGIYLNLKGREGRGILEETEAELVRRAICEGLAGLPDEVTGCPAVRSVSRREDLYRGPFVADSPDLLVNFNPGFRVSWASAGGGFAANLLEDNTRRWSGDHIMDPEAVPGILFMNRPTRATAPKITDLAPTILRYLGVPAPESMEGSSLLE